MLQLRSFSVKNGDEPGGDVSGKIAACKSKLNEVHDLLIKWDEKCGNELKAQNEAVSFDYCTLLICSEVNMFSKVNR